MRAVSSTDGAKEAPIELVALDAAGAFRVLVRRSQLFEDQLLGAPGDVRTERGALRRDRATGDGAA